ncbi:MAG: flagellar biosynthesis protein FlgD [Alphaproteobacteria bacterium]|nr:flagellar biosynthesis protein FlgD [Alphaproteobacteria bacterium]
MATINAGVTSNVTATTGTSSTSSAVNSNTLASNFTTFLQLLTTQLKNQNPLDPLDTNQFTQQLVQFAQVEQQLKSNDQLATLVSLQQAVQQTQALGFVGMTVAVDGSSAQLANGNAAWGFSISKPASATVNITNSAGALVYTGTFSVNAGVLQPDGAYKLSVTAKDASGQTVGAATETIGVVDSVDMTQTPPKLNIGGTDYTLDKIKRVVRQATSG